MSESNRRPSCPRSALALGQVHLSVSVVCCGERRPVKPSNKWRVPLKNTCSWIKHCRILQRRVFKTFSCLQIYMTRVLRTIHSLEYEMHLTRDKSFFSSDGLQTLSELWQLISTSVFPLIFQQILSCPMGEFWSICLRCWKKGSGGALVTLVSLPSSNEPSRPLLLSRSDWCWMATNFPLGGGFKYCISPWIVSKQLDEGYGDPLAERRQLK